MIYGCPGIAAFIAEQIAVQDHGGQNFYIVASDGRGVAGCAEGRRLPGRLFLNYIAVRPAYRSLGLGRRLLRALLKSLFARLRKRMAMQTDSCLRLLPCAESQLFTK